MHIEDVLQLFKDKIEAIDPMPQKYLISKGSANGFEELVAVIAIEVEKELKGQLITKMHLGHHFPDMDLELNGSLYGLELKSRNNGTWDTNGNSVFESISDNDYEEIYLLFGSKVKDADKILVKYAPYWACTSSINVTHSPRFKINMDTDSSVFSSSTDYHNLRGMSEVEKIAFLQDYLKNNTAGIKWFVPQDSESVKPISLNSLDADLQARIKAEIFVLFPQDLISSGKAKYTRATEFLLTHYFYYSSSLRDFFSAGGQWTYEDVGFPKMLENLAMLKPQITYVLENANHEFMELAYSSWQELDIHLKKASFSDDYYSVIDYLGNLHFNIKLRDAGVEYLSEIS